MSEFDPLAENYDTPQQMETAKIIAEAIRDSVSTAKEGVAIDYGCGTGLVGLALLDVFKSILFVDSSINMLEITKKKIEALGADNADTLFADFSVEIPDGIAVDYIFMSRVLHHVIDYEPFLASLYELLNEGGHLIVVDFDEIEPEEEADSPESSDLDQQRREDGVDDDGRHRHNHGGSSGEAHSHSHGDGIFHDMHLGLDQEVLVGILNKLSFKNVESKTFHHGKKIFRNRDASLFILHGIK